MRGRFTSKKCIPEFWVHNHEAMLLPEDGIMNPCVLTRRKMLQTQELPGAKPRTGLTFKVKYFHIFNNCLATLMLGFLPPPVVR